MAPELAGSKSTVDVSIIIPTHNEGVWLKRTVDGIRDATHHVPYEILIVDDGSNDGSCSFLEQNSPEDSGIRLVSGSGLGVAGARALGAYHASGENLVFLDAHVIPDRGWLAEIVSLLSDPTVGIAGIGVRDIHNPAYLGYAYVPANENLNAAWASPQGSPPFDVPAIIGCCFGIRKSLYQEIGGFDPGSVGWGVDDIEFSLRAWFMGYRCVSSPAVQVAHWFKELGDRSYSVSWEEYDVNLLRCAFTYFEGPRLAAILTSAAERATFRRSLARVHADGAYWRRRSWLRARFRHGEQWYFERFSSELAPLERRLRRVLHEQRSRVSMNIQRNTNCPSCGAKNLGIQEQCLLCGADLPASDAASIARSQGEPVRADAECSVCHAVLKPGVKFCTACGAPVAG